MIQNINLGASPNDKTGTKARVAGQMINANFAYLEAKINNKSYIKVETGFTLVAQDLTFNADWEWMINNIDYTNPSSVVINIPFAASGKSRIDLIVCNTSNTFNRVAGVESVSTPVAPALPTNTVMATFFTVTDGGFGDLTQPVIGADYVTKREKSAFQVYQSGEINNTVLDDFFYGYLNFRDAVTNLKSIGTNTNAHLYYGRELLIKNSQATDITIYHLTGSGFQFSFPNEVNFILKPNEIIRFSTKILSPTSGILEYVGVVLTKADVGLGNVDNTSDADKPVSGPQQTALDLKIDKVAGKGLSTEDYTTSEKNKLASIDATHYLAPLQTTVQLSALPQATVSDKARVYVENDLSDYFYDVTASSGDIAPDDQAGGIGFWRKVAVGGETAVSIKTKYESNADTNAFTNALKAKLDSITEIFTTALKTGYDGVVTGYTALMATGSRLITSGEITKLGNTSGTNTGDNATNTQYSGLAASKENVANKSDSYTASSSTTYASTKALVDGLALQIPLTQKGSINGVATLGDDGKVPNSQIPALAISETYPVSSQTEMLALSQAEQGDVAIRSDISKSYILRTSPSSVLSNWSELLSPTDAVSSVNGQVGAVSVTALSIGAQTTLTNPITGVGSQNDPSTYALQDGTILYHSTKWFVPTGTVSTSGATVTSVGTQFNNAMVGAKLTINGEWRIITGYTSSTAVTVASAYSQNYSGVVAGSWGVYSKAYVSSGLIGINTVTSIFFNSTGVAVIYIDQNGNYQATPNFAVFGGTVVSSMFTATSNINLATNSNVLFNANGQIGTNGTKDLGIRRNTAGVLEIYNGVTADGAIGNRRDLLARNYTGSATLTGTPTAPTATVGTNTTQIATTAFVQANSVSLSANKQNSLAVDGTGTKYPTVDAINSEKQIKKIVYEGDSLTDTSGSGYPTNYPNQISDYNFDFSRAEQVNVAQAGDQIQAFIAGGQYASQIQPHKPVNGKENVVFCLMMGTNDLAVGRTPTQVYDDLKTVWAQAKADKFTVVALTVTRSTNATRDAGAVAVAELIASEPTLYDYLIRTDLILPDPSDTFYFNVDGIHLTEEGSKKIAKELNSVITSQINGYDYLKTSLPVINGNVSIGKSKAIEFSKLDIKGFAAPAMPANSGTSQSTGVISRFGDSGNLVLDLGSASASGAWLQSTDALNLSINYPLLLNPNGGDVKIKSAVVESNNKDALIVSDTRTQATGVGGSILFKGVYTDGGLPLDFGRISLMKENSTHANYSFGLGFYTSNNGGTNPSANPNFYISGSGAATFTSSITAADYNGGATLTGTPTAPTAAVGTNTTQIATTAFVQATRPYKVYTALLSQTGTNAPTATVLENTLGGTIVWTRVNPGFYSGTLTGAFTTDKTILLNNNPVGGVFTNTLSSVNTITIQTRNYSNVQTDDGLSNTSIEIRVYN